MLVCSYGYKKEKPFRPARGEQAERNDFPLGDLFL